MIIALQLIQICVNNNNAFRAASLGDYYTITERACVKSKEYIQTLYHYKFQLYKTGKNSKFPFNIPNSNDDVTGVLIIGI